MNYIIPFLAVWCGFAAGYFMPQLTRNRLRILLAFSGAFLLSVVAFELLPEIFETGSKQMGLYLLAGIFLQIILEFFSRGAEHGHVNLNAHDKSIPTGLFLALSLHALIEGMPLADKPELAWAISIHKIPVAIIFTGYCIQIRMNLPRLLLFIGLFSVMTPLGSLLAFESSFLIKYHDMITAIAAGIMIHVSTTLIFESSQDHRFNLTKLLSIAIAVTIAWFL